MEDKRITAEQILAEIGVDVEKMAQKVTQAVNDGRAGSVIDDSEESVSKVTARFRQQVFERAIQMKTEAADAAFSPSQESEDEKEVSS